MGLLSSIFGFSQNNNLIELTSKQDKEGYWKDLIFSITKKEKLDNGYLSLTCKAKYKNEIVGFKINIVNEIPAGIINGEINNQGFMPKGIEIYSIGKESDKLIEAISKLYEQPKKNKFTKEKVAFTVFSLNKEKAILTNGIFRFKLFFDENNEHNLYSEFYINVDLEKRMLELNEKDAGYRENIVKILSEK